MEGQLAQVVLEDGELRGWVRYIGKAWDNLDILCLREDYLVTADGQELVFPPSYVHVDDRCKFHISLAEFVVANCPRHRSERVVQLIEVYVSILATSREAHIIMEPVNAHDFTLVAAELEALSVLTRVKVVDINVLILDNAGEQMTTVRELNLIATLEHSGSERKDLVAQHVAPNDFVLQGDN